MHIDYIIDNVQKLIIRCESRDPKEICNRMGVYLKYMNLQQKLKGFYFYQSRIHHIVIDENIIDSFQNVLIAHELGHYCLHKDIAMMKRFHELEVLQGRKDNPTEYEANLFAAELLIEDQAVLTLLKEYSFFETASILGVPAALLDFKFALLQAKGYSLHMQHYSQSNFLKNDIGAYDERNNIVYQHS